MSRIRSKGTLPELAVQSALKRIGLRFRIHDKRLPGTPDVVVAKLRTVVFVHGCFWHRHRNCKFAYSPKSRLNFWNTKFKLNVERDRRLRRDLRTQDWKVVVIWECQTRDEDRLETLLRRLLAIDAGKAV